MVNYFYVDINNNNKKTLPSSVYLFKINNEYKKLNRKMAIKFHNMVAKGLFTSKLVRVDMKTVIEFL